MSPDFVSVIGALLLIPLAKEPPEGAPTLAMPRIQKAHSTGEVAPIRTGIDIGMFTISKSAPRIPPGTDEVKPAPVAVLPRRFSVGG